MVKSKEHEYGQGRRDKIKLESTAGTGHFYTTTKNKRNMPEKMAIKKFDPVVRKHVEYKETKIKIRSWFRLYRCTKSLAHARLFALRQRLRIGRPLPLLPERQSDRIACRTLCLSAILFYMPSA